jgi:hypothetical protein
MDPARLQRVWQRLVPRSQLLTYIRSGSWRATRHLLMRAHGASGKVIRGGNVTSSGSRPPPVSRMGSPYRRFPSGNSRTDCQTLLLRDPRPAASSPANFADAYNFARRLKALRGLTPYEFICKAWTSEPHRFKISPLQQMQGLNR